MNADKTQLQEDFINLLNNTIYISETNGNISINAEKKEYENQISIMDSSIGMIAYQINEIVDEIYETDESRHDFNSSGLGMPIA